MGGKSCWRLSVIFLLAVRVAPISASADGSVGSLTCTSPLHQPTTTTRRIRRCRQAVVAKSLVRRALEVECRHLLPRVLSRSSPLLLASTTTTSQQQLAPANNAGTRSTALSSLPMSAMKRVAKIPPLLLSKLKEQRPPKDAGYYYGLMPDRIFPYDSSRHRAEEAEKNQQLAMAQTLSETLEEMKNMRKELQTLRREMYEMRKKITGEQDLEFEGGLQVEEVDPEVARLAQQKRQRQFDRLGREVEKWARQKLFEEDRVGNGWTEVACNKMVGKSVNPEGSTSCFLNWLPDTRGKNAFPDDKREYPCIKVYGTLDAPLEDVCTYLSRKEHMTDYNDVLAEQRDLEEIAPHSKITLATSPQVLFVKPREFVTFVHHRWLNDGTVVMINQACEHQDAPAVTEEGKGKACRGYALRGATFLSPDPQDPEKTRMAMISHAAPGGNLPQWAVKTAIGAVTPIEPFKLFHKISENVKKAKPELEQLKLERMEQVSVPGRSNQPVGMAQIGFAAFWPKGGGLLPAVRPPVGGASPAVKGPENVSGQEEPLKETTATDLEGGATE